MKLQVLFFLIFLIVSCTFNSNTNQYSESTSQNLSNEDQSQSDSTDKEQNSNLSEFQTIEHNRKLIKLGHTINTEANEYLPVISTDEQTIFFSAMDRTGFFDFKIDFNRQKSAGGEDLFYSTKKNGIWSDARPLTALSTNGHEVINQVFKNGDFLLTANYPEKLGPKGRVETETTDLFIGISSSSDQFRISHFPEPVNSIYSEADGWMDEQRSFILFASDRPKNVGEYHKKGWKWNSNFWGNTDIYVSVMNGDFWSVPINLGATVNTPGAERTPWLSPDGLTLYISSNGYSSSQDVYSFKRTDRNNWTNWEGPFIIKDANSEYDDWGYKEDKYGNAYFSRAIPLGFKPTQGGSSGDAGFRETNFRTGYEVFGQQIAALIADQTTDIYFLQKENLPALVIEDIFFEFNSAKINTKLESQLKYILDYINQNKGYTIEIHGHTDNIGSSEYNMNLSAKRAESVKSYLTSNGSVNNFNITAFGSTKPVTTNDTEIGRAQNRRVELYFVK